MAARIIFGILLLATAAEPQAAWVGKWKLDPAKSTTASDRYKRVISTIEPWEGGLRVSYDMVGRRGGVIHMEWTGKFDGKDYPVEGVDYVLTNAYTLIDDHNYEIVLKSEGVPVGNAHVQVSADGKTLTAVTTERGPRGQSVTTTAVYKKE
jgi:hypothetical protein